MEEGSRKGKSQRNLRQSFPALKREGATSQGMQAACRSCKRQENVFSADRNTALPAS